MSFSLFFQVVMHLTEEHVPIRVLEKQYWREEIFSNCR